MIILQAFLLGLLLVAAFIYAQFLFDRYAEKSVTSWLDTVKTRWFYWPVQVLPFILLILGSGWFLTP